MRFVTASSSRLVLALLLGVAACSQPSPEATSSVQSPLEALLQGRVEMVDLTHALSSEAPFWPSPGGNPFEHTILAAHDSGRAAMAAYATPEHFGTHLDAPTHSRDGQPTVDELTAAQLFGPAVVIDVGEAVVSNADYALTLQDVLDWEQRHGEIPPGAVVLMATGWASRWPDQAAYANQDAEGAMHFPGFGAEAAAFLVRDRAIRGIGVDTFSVDPATGGFAVHGIVNGAGGYHLESLASLQGLPPTGAFLIVAPIKIAGGSGGQVRVFALVP